MIDGEEELVADLTRVAHRWETGTDEGRSYAERRRRPDFAAGAEPTVKRVARPPASPGELAGSEARLGFALPPLWRAVLARVGNGGFGPGYGTLGVEGGAGDDHGWNAVDRYLGWRELDAKPPFPARLLPLCSWGGAVYSCVDASTPEGRVVRFDPNKGRGRGAPMITGFPARCFVVEAESIGAWLRAWVEGRDLSRVGGRGRRART